MTPDSRKPGAAFWATVAAVVLLVLYPLSQGPWIVAYVAVHSDQPEIDVSCAIYEPLDIAHENSPPAIQEAYDRYVEWCVDLGFTLGDVWDSR